MAIRRMFYLGDSLTDSDEFWNLSRQVLKEPLPDQDWYATQFSDGVVHSDVAPGLLGYEARDAYNYAFGGARAVGSREARSFVGEPDWLKVPLGNRRLDTDINLGAQTGRMLRDADARDWDLASSAATVWIGVNDLAAWEPSSVFPWQWDDEIDDLVDDIVGSIGSSLDRLLDAGIGQVWVGTLPEASFFPAYNDAGWLTEYMSDGVIGDLNDELAELVRDARDDGGAVGLLDINAMTSEIEADPRAYGFRTIEEAVLRGHGTDYDPEPNPDLERNFDLERDGDEVGFIDQVHPTAAMHRVLAVFQAEAIATRLVVAGSGGNRIEGGGRAELILARQGNDTVAAGAGNDVVLAGTGNDRVDGNDGSDLMCGGAGQDTLDGGVGSDLLTGGYGRDTLRGGSSADVLIDAPGSDTMECGAGDDLVLWLDPRLAHAELGSQADRIDGGSDADAAIFYVADRGTLEAALDDYGDGTGSSFDLPSLGVTVSGVESLEFILARDDGDIVLPDTGSAALDDRLVEAGDWGFV